MKKKIAATLGIIGFIIMLGTAGTADTSNIPFAQFVYQMLAGGICMLFAGIMLHNETY